MPEPKLNYYTGDLEKKFNYYWEAGREITNPWAEFVRLVDANTKVKAIRATFYSVNTPTVAKMSHHAYYRWLRSLNHQRPANRVNNKIKA